MYGVLRPNLRGRPENRGRFQRIAEMRRTESPGRGNAASYRGELGDVPCHQGTVRVKPTEEVTHDLVTP